MDARFWKAGSRLPSIDAFLDGIADDVHEDRSAIVLLQPGVDSLDVLEELRVRLSLRQQCWRIYLSEELVEQVDLDSRSAAAISSQLDAALDGMDILLVHGLGQLPDELRRRLFGALVSWSASPVPEGGDSAARVFCIVDPAAALLGCLPSASSNSRVELYWWWGFPSSLELRLATRVLFDDDGADWLECVVGGAAAGDVGTAAVLWEARPTDALQTRSSLSGLQPDAATATPNGSYLASSASASASDGATGPRASSAPPSRYRTDWACGRVVWSQEFGLEPSAALVAAQGDAAELDRRLWRGQAPTVLPLADGIRLSASQFLCRRHGQLWYQKLGASPCSNSESLRLEENPLDAELGFLEVVLRGSVASQDERRWLNRVAIARQARNELAHYRPVSRQLFDSFLLNARDCQSSRSFERQLARPRR